MSTTTETITTAEAFHPAEYIREEARARGWSMGRFTDELGVSNRAAQQLFYGELRIKKTWAKRLSRTFGTSHELWLNLQASYDRHMESVKARESE